MAGTDLEQDSAVGVEHALGTECSHPALVELTQHLDDSCARQHLGESLNRDLAKERREI